MITLDTLGELRAMLPQANDLDPIITVTIADDQADNGKPHEVALCIAYGGHYWACLTCEAQGYADNTHDCWDTTARDAYAAEHGPLNAVPRGDKVIIVNVHGDPIPANLVHPEPIEDAVRDAAQGWHDEL